MYGLNNIVPIIETIILLLTFPGSLQLMFLTLMALMSRKEIPLDKNALATNLAIVIPAHNEETGIAQTLQSLQSCYHSLENKNIFVVADNCTDKTIDVSNRYDVSILERVDDQLRGKGYALNYAFSEILKGDFDAVIVIDADTTVDRNLIDTFRNLFATGESAGQATYSVKNANAGIRPRLMKIAFLAFNYLRPLGRDNANISAGILGNGFGLSIETLKSVPYDSFSIVEDLEYHLRLIKSGIKVRFLSNTTVWSDMPVTTADAQSQRERWEGGRLRILKDQVPKLISQIVRGRLELIEPLFELLLLPIAFHVSLLIALLLIGSPGFKLFALIALTIVVFHVVVAMIKGRATWRDWNALLSAPLYIAWKITKLGGIIKSANKESTWKRTKR